MINLHRTAAASLAVLFIAGCGGSPKTNHADGSAIPAPAPGGTRQITLHVPEMGTRLKLLWADWPNRVKQALAGLEGVEVKDEWDRNPDQELTEDLLFVTFDAGKISEEEILEVVRNEGFEVEVRP